MRFGSDWWARLLFSWIVNAVAVALAAWLLGGVTSSGVTAAAFAGLVLGLVNAYVKPVLTVLGIPFIVITLGVGLFLINRELMRTLLIDPRGRFLLGLAGASLLSGIVSMKESSIGESRQALAMCSSSEALLYCVSTLIRESPELTKLDRTMSMILYRPPKGTAGFARSFVSGPRRRPSPPARIMTRTREVSNGPLSMNSRIGTEGTASSMAWRTPKFGVSLYGLLVTVIALGGPSGAAA